MPQSFDLDFQASFEGISEEDLRKQHDYAEKRIRNGLEKGDSFDLLEAESTLMRVGPFVPSQETAELVAARISEPDYHKDFDLLRLTGYLHDQRIRTILEDRYEDLKVIWKEQDDLRLAESYRTMLSNVERRAADLSALKIAADPYMNTLDEFFSKSFNDKNLQRYPQLSQLYDNLQDLRRAGGFSKDSLLGALTDAQTRLGGYIEEKMKALDERYQGNQPKPNRVIAIYYCLLEALLGQRSPRVVIDDEFIDKISQDFRAAIGAGTKRFVLNTLLRFNHPSFAEIAAEARYSLQPSIIEKVERKEDGDPEFKYQKVDLNEMQVFELYRTASEVIAKNPVDAVYQDLLHSYNVASLLLGLRGLRLADLPPAAKLRHLQTLFNLGTVNEYVFVRAMDVLASLDIPAARSLMARVLSERLGWRKVRLPKKAFALINAGLAHSRTSGDIYLFARDFISETRLQAAAAGEELTFPFEQTVYDSTIEKITERFEKNPFHGINELAQHRLFRSVLAFIQHTPLDYAAPGKRRGLALIRRLYQVSRGRLNVMLEEFRAAFESFKARTPGTSDAQLAEYRNLLTDFKRTLHEMGQHLTQPHREEALLRRLPKDVTDYFERKRSGQTGGVAINRTLQEIITSGPSIMDARDRNIRESGKKKITGVDQHMLCVRYPASSRAVIRATETLELHQADCGEPMDARIIRGFAMDKIPQPLGLGATKVISAEKTEQLWAEMRPQLEKPLTYEELLVKRMYIALLTQGAAANGLSEVLDGLQHSLYNAIQPPEARLAFLQSLPLEFEHAERWRTALAHETEAVLLALKRFLGPDRIIRLKALVPELLDLFD